MHERVEKQRHKIYDQLQLTEEQKKQLEANKEKQRTQMKASFEQMKSFREAMRQELMKSNLDMNKVNGIHVQIKNLHSQMADQRLDSVLEVRKILTPEQFARFHSFMREHRQQWRDKAKERKQADKEESKNR